MTLWFIDSAALQISMVTHESRKVLSFHFLNQCYTQKGFLFLFLYLAYLFLLRGKWQAGVKLGEKTLPKKQKLNKISTIVQKICTSTQFLLKVFILFVSVSWICPGVHIPTVKTIHAKFTVQLCSYWSKRGDLYNGRSDFIQTKWANRNLEVACGNWNQILAFWIMLVTSFFFTEKNIVRF